MTYARLLDSHDAVSWFVSTIPVSLAHAPRAGSATHNILLPQNARVAGVVWTPTAESPARRAATAKAAPPRGTPAPARSPRSAHVTPPASRARAATPLSAAYVAAPVSPPRSPAARPVSMTLGTPHGVSSAIAGAPTAAAAVTAAATADTDAARGTRGARAMPDEVPCSGTHVRARTDLH